MFNLLSLFTACEHLLTCERDKIYEKQIYSRVQICTQVQKYNRVQIVQMNTASESNSCQSLSRQAHCR